MADGDLDPNLTLRISGDASGVIAAAEQAAAGLEKTEREMLVAKAVAEKYGVSVDVAAKVLASFRADATAAQVAALKVQMQGAAEATDDAAASEMAKTAADETSAESAEKLNAMMRENQQMLMRNAFYVHRLAEGFKDISMGGRLAGQGVMDVSESLQYMLGPEYAIYAAVAQVVAMLAVAVTMHRRRAGEAREAADAEKAAAEEVKDAWTEANDVFEAEMKKIEGGKFWDQMLASAQAVTTEITNQATAAQSVEAAEAKLAEARQKQALAQLDLEEQLELAKALGNEKEEARIKLRYEGMKKLVEAKDEESRKQVEIENTKNERDMLVAEGQSHQEQITAAQEDLQKSVAKQKEAETATALLKSDYFNALDQRRTLEAQMDNAKNGRVDDQGNRVQPLTPAQAVELQNLRNPEYIETLRKRDLQNGPSFDEQVKQWTEARKNAETAEGNELKGASPHEQEEIIKRYGDWFKQIDANLEAVAKLTDARKQVDDAHTSLDKATDDNNKFLTENSTKIETLGIKLDQLNVELATARTNEKTGTQQNANETRSLYYRQVDDNSKELVEKFEESQKASEKAGEAPLEANVRQDSDALAGAQESLRQIQGHLGEIREIGAKHSENVQQTVAAAKALVEELRTRQEQDEQALRDFKQAAKTNAQQ